MAFKEVLIEAVDKQLKEHGNTNKAFILPSDFAGTHELGSEEMEWWDKVVDESTLIKDIGVHPTSDETIYESELRFSGSERIFKPGQAGTDPGDTSAATTNQRSWKPEEYVATIPWTLGTLEDVRDGEQVYQRFLAMAAKAGANQMEQDLLHGVISGSNNSHRGSTYGYFDGILEVIRAGGNVVDKTSGFTNRSLAVDGGVNDAFTAALDTLPSKYDSNELRWLGDPSLIRHVAALRGAQGFQLADRMLLQGEYGGVDVHGNLFYRVPKLRTDFLVQGTGTAITGTHGATQVNGSGVAKALATTITVDAITNFADTDKIVVGGLSAAKSYGINAENRVISGTPSGTLLTLTAAMAYDHDDNEYVTEFAVAPTANGHHVVLSALDNFMLGVRRGMTVEIFREPRKRAWTVVMSIKIVPIVLNPEAAVLIRDFDV